MNYHPAEATIPYSKTWPTSKVNFDAGGRPYLNTETETVYLTEFDDYFIHQLSDRIQASTATPGDGLCIITAFRNLYIQTLLDCRHDYSPDAEQCP
jgi:hypothetical protein